MVPNGPDHHGFDNKWSGLVWSNLAGKNDGLIWSGPSGGPLRIFRTGPALNGLVRLNGLKPCSTTPLTTTSATTTNTTTTTWVALTTTSHSHQPPQPPPFIHICLVRHRGGAGPATLVQHTVHSNATHCFSSAVWPKTLFTLGTRNARAHSTPHVRRGHGVAWSPNGLFSQHCQPSRSDLGVHHRSEMPSTLLRPLCAVPVPHVLARPQSHPRKGDPGQLEQLFSAPDLIALGTARQEGQLDLCSTCLGRAGLALDHRGERHQRGIVADTLSIESAYIHIECVVYCCVG